QEFNNGSMASPFNAFGVQSFRLRLSVQKFNNGSMPSAFNGTGSRVQQWFNGTTCRSRVQQWFNGFAVQKFNLLIQLRCIFCRRSA
ncbi:MAG TPA: hypothetical protein PLB43_02655, partial [Prolixibacteraceae bacterium]|nr:hypothetical protein [Prolixibacteraceae bacterium]